jgi:N-acetylneuraminic acid mutarotase
MLVKNTLFDMDQQVPQNTLYALDLDTLKWQQVQPAEGSSAPPPRSFAALAHHDGCLYVYGGRTGWISNSGKLLRDVWRFTIATRIWERVPGRHPRMNGVVGPAVMHEGSW